MSATGSRGRSPPYTIQQLRDKIAILLNAAGQQSEQQKTEFLNQYFAKWSMNQQRMTHQQFIGALQSLHMPLSAAGEVFGALDADGSGYIDIREFCDGMIGGTQSQASASSGQPASQPRPAMRNAGSEIVNRGRQPQQPPPGAANERAAPTPTNNDAAASAPSGRGYTPMGSQGQMAPFPKPGAQGSGGSRNGSRMGSANRSPVPALPMTPQQQLTIKPSPQASASRPRVNRATNGVEVDFSDIVISKFREIVLSRGGSSGIHSLGRIFRIIDDDRNRRISLEELSSGLQDFGLQLGMKDLQLLLAAIDKDNTGSLGFDEFVACIRGVVNKRRQALINMAFDVLDTTGDGMIMVDDLVNRFDVQGHPDVAAGMLPPEQGLAHFLSQFDGVDQNGVVTREEFLGYYRNISASIDDDDYFELMIRNAWHISGGAGQSQNTASTRLLVNLVDGSQKVVTLEHDLGLDMRNAAAVKAQLKAQGIANVVSFSTGGQI